MTTPPPRVPGFRVRELLGNGATSTVWRGEPRRRGPAVALKHVPHRLADALPEAQALAALDHPNLIAVRSIRRLRGETVLVLDLASGGTLADVLARRHTLPVGEVVAALTPVASALSAVHAAGLIHGDVHPGNILFGADGLPLLSDLGSAYWLGTEGAGALPPPGFADPLVEQGYLTGQAGDVFSLAAVAYRALTGSGLPSLPGNVLSHATRDSHERQCAQGLDAAPQPLREVLLAGLSLDTSRRPGAAELALRLRFAAPMTGVDLHAGRHSALTPLTVITRGARLPVRAGGDRSRSRPRFRLRLGRRDTPPPRPSQ